MNGFQIAFLGLGIAMAALMVFVPPMPVFFQWFLIVTVTVLSIVAARR